MNTIKLKSEVTISNLKYELRKKIKHGFYAVVVLVLLALASFNYKAELFFLLFLAVNAGLMCLLFSVKVKRLNNDLSANTSILESMKTCKNAVSNMLSVERMWMYFIYFLMFMYYVSKETFETDSPTRLIIYTGVMALVFIITIALSERHNQRKIGKNLKELEENIIRLETCHKYR